MALSFHELVNGVGQGASGDYRQGLGNTVVYGQADLEPGDYGQQYVMTTKPNTTVMSKRVGVAPVARRQNITRMINELEFFAGTPGVHPRVLAQKVWQARKALMQSSRWDWANYQNQRTAYDSYDDLVSRLESVERVLGVGRMSPKVMSQLYGSGMSGLGAYTGPAWGETFDPVTKLASCIRGMLCQPKAFCCDQGTYYDEDLYYEELPEFEDEFPDFPNAGGGGGGGGRVSTNGARVQPQPKPAVAVRQPYVQPKAAVAVRQPYVQPKPAVTVGRTVAVAPVTQPRTLVGGGGVARTPGVLVGGAGRPVTGVVRGVVRGSGGGGGGTAVSVMGGLGGLGRRRSSPAMSRLIDQLRAARQQVRRTR